MKNENIKNILSSNLKPVVEANIMMKAVIYSIKTYELSSINRDYLSIYDFENNNTKYFDIKKSKDIDYVLKLAYFNEWQKKIKFDKKWVILVESKFRALLDNSKKAKFFEFCFKDFESEKNRVSNELTQIFIQSIKRYYIEERKEGLESSWFYIEFGRVLSDFFIKKAFSVDKEKTSKIVQFLDDIKIPNNKLKAFFSANSSIVEFFNKTFSKKFDINFSNIIEHFLIQHYLSSKKSYEFNVDFFNKLNLQYVEYSSDLINDILEECFDNENINENKKTYKLFKPKKLKGLPNIYNINKNLPSVSLEFNIDKTLNKYFTADNHAFDIFFQSNINFLHSNMNLNSVLTNEYIDIIKNLRNINSFKINVEMLLYLINVFTHKIKSSVIELYGLDLSAIFAGHKSLTEIEKWSLDFDNLNRFKLSTKKKFLNSVIDTIYSKKLTLYETVKQGCIMLCFEKFYFDWFSDSRGRLYCQQSCLNLQGSNISKLLVSPFVDTKLDEKNKDYVYETLSSFFVKNENTINSLKESNHFLLKQDIENEKITSNYALDASSSGLQMLSIILKNRNLGKKCGLLKSDDNIDLYTKVSLYLKCCIDDDNVFLKQIMAIPGLYDLIQTRKFSKLPIMTIPYNSTKFGRLDQMMESFMDFCFLKGIFVENKHLIRLKKVLHRLDDLLIEWCKKEMPECFKFIKKIKTFIFGKQFDNSFISNGYCSFNYRTTLKSVSRRKIGIRSKNSKAKTKISVFFFKKYENASKSEKYKIKSKINNSFIANLIHNVDSRIAINLVKLCAEKNIKFYTIHDCFRIEYDYASNLKNLICQEYISLYEYDFLLKNSLPIDQSLADVSLNDFILEINKSFFVKP